MADPRPGAEEWVPGHPDLAALRAAASDCRGCELWKPATKVVFSTGAASARMVLVGEQPGDQEDRAGEPFVGPAGRLLDRAIEEAGIARREIYLTNAVKRFRFERRGKRRIHEKPAIAHIDACRPWLRAELAVVRPRIVVCLGATAAQSVLGRDVRVGAERGRVLDESDPPALITTHPSALLRTRDPADRDAAYSAFVADLRSAHEAAA